MNEEEKISRNMLISIFIGCLLLLAAVAFFCIVNSPKTVAPTFSEASEEESFPEYGSVSANTEDISGSEDPASVFPIDINTASAEELQLIPDIGPATAKLIIDYRNENGTIVAFRELMSINGIGAKTVELLKEYCIIK